MTDPEHAQGIEHLRALAESLDCVLEEDLCALYKIKHSTAEAWGKRAIGPAYVIAGNARLYPRDAIKADLKARQRERRPSGTAKDQL
jgi:hypothetical protein